MMTTTAAVDHSPTTAIRRPLLGADLDAIHPGPTQQL